jgi:hypothetical protein
MGADISRLTAKGDCSLKCAYDFNYHASNSTVTNKGDSIDISYDTTIFPPVSFNELKYQVTGIEIYQPSLHTYNGVRADAEIYINHKQEDMDYFLSVCIPLVSSNNYTNASKIITDIINTTADLAPNENDKATLSLGQELSLQTIVPVSPFISYSFWTVNVIAFEIDYAIPVSVDTLNKLRSIIKARPAMPDNFVDKETYYNRFGPNRGNSDDIYISCQPTGASGETIQAEKEKAKNTVQFDFTTILNNPLFLGLFVMFLFIIFLFIVNALYAYIFVGKDTRPGSSGVTNGTKGNVLPKK